MHFAGKAVLVTGATSGIGAAVARGFCAAGADVLMSGRDSERAQALLAELDGATGRARFVGGDVADPATCNRLVETAQREFGRLDVLVNNAGIIHRASVDETTDAQWRRTMAVNLDAVFFLCRAAVPAMRRLGGGAIVNVASDWALVGGERSVAYCASKGALVAMTRAMALDHAGEGIRINAVCPTDIATPMLDSEFAALGETREAGLARLGDYIPMGRVGTPDEVAQAVLFLASPAAGFITGIALPVDGGVTAG